MLRDVSSVQHQVMASSRPTPRRTKPGIYHEDNLKRIEMMHNWYIVDSQLIHHWFTIQYGFPKHMSQTIVQKNV